MEKPIQQLFAMKEPRKPRKKGYTNVRVKTVNSDVVILCLTYVDVALSNTIESFLVVYGPKEKKIDIIDNFNKSLA